MTRQDLIDQIAAALHRYEHPTYTSVAACTFCYAAAHEFVEQRVEEGSS